MCYGAAPTLLFGERSILSRTGVQQGDPLGPALFCLHPLLAEIQAGLVGNAWYLDVGYFAGPPEDVLRAFRIITTQGPPPRSSPECRQVRGLESVW